MSSISKIVLERQLHFPIIQSSASYDSKRTGTISDIRIWLREAGMV